MKNRETPIAIKRRATVKTLRLKRKTKSILFVLSLIINAYCINKMVLFNNESKTTVIVKNNDATQKSMVEKIYSLSNYKSVSKFSATAEDRYNKLIRAYSEDSLTPRERRYSEGVVKRDWERYCKDRVRRIVNLQSRIYDLEKVLENMFNGVDNTQMMDAIKAKGYEEQLSEMSNYYASFLDEYSYNLIVQTAD
jgi:ribosomal protein L30/L7E